MKNNRKVNNKLFMSEDFDGIKNSVERGFKMPEYLEPISDESLRVLHMSDDIEEMDRNINSELYMSEDIFPLVKKKNLKLHGVVIGYSNSKVK